jgi:hypothetical protein
MHTVDMRFIKLPESRTCSFVVAVVVVVIGGGKVNGLAVGILGTFGHS